jgi:hypothetical protein
MIWRSLSRSSATMISRKCNWTLDSHEYTENLHGNESETPAHLRLIQPLVIVVLKVHPITEIGFIVVSETDGAEDDEKESCDYVTGRLREAVHPAECHEGDYVPYCCHCELFSEVSLNSLHEGRGSCDGSK